MRLGRPGRRRSAGGHRRARSGSGGCRLRAPRAHRADLTFAPTGSEQPGEVTYTEAFAVQPLGNTLVTMTLTGSQLHTLLEQQWCNQSIDIILQVSEGFTFAWGRHRA
ncbi:MAG: 5'-nucleotidase C-terminal domain-containing protein [Acidimicrobiales bacterium]